MSEVSQKEQNIKEHVNEFNITALDMLTYPIPQSMQMDTIHVKIYTFNAEEAKMLLLYMSRFIHLTPKKQDITTIRVKIYTFNAEEAKKLLLYMSRFIHLTPKKRRYYYYTCQDLYI